MNEHESQCTHPTEYRVWREDFEVYAEFCTLCNADTEPTGMWRR